MDKQKLSQLQWAPSDSDPDTDMKRMYSETYRMVARHNELQNIYRNELRTPQLDAVEHQIAANRIGPDAKVVEVGCGIGHLHRCHKNWQGFEYADTAVELAKRTYGQDLNISEADGRDLPLEANSVDFLFSYDALEHMPLVERAFAEIERVLKPGGIAYLAPAWNCRPWVVSKLDVRPYDVLSLFEKIGKLLIPLRENVLFRLLCSLPGRMKREALLLLGSGPLPLDYQPLKPNFHLWQTYERAADDDAVVSMDMHAALAYFRSRGWEVPSHPTFPKRFACRSEPILVRKPA
jgi:SAM-dependent methyltransferase